MWWTKKPNKNEFKITHLSEIEPGSIINEFDRSIKYRNPLDEFKVDNDKNQVDNGVDSEQRLVEK